ncbi:MAG: hypothetical protein ACXW3D_10995 [Caulobacteraceae bacterium]
MALAALPPARPTPSSERDSFLPAASALAVAFSRPPTPLAIFFTGASARSTA